MMTADDLAEGVLRLFTDMGCAGLREMRLRIRRRVDVMAISPAGEIAVVEIKTSRADYRSDTKWQEYLDFCDMFYFAVPVDFPKDILPDECGLIVADRYGAVVERPAPMLCLGATRRRNVTLRFALTAASRLREAAIPLARPFSDTGRLSKDTGRHSRPRRPRAR